MTFVAADKLPGLLGHELRNPLASAMTGAMLAREMVDGDDPRGAVLDGVLRDLDRMTALLDGWLRLARTGSTAPGAVVVADLLAAVAARHGAEVVSVCGDAVVTGDRGLLERALDNLLENARQAGARTLRLAAHCTDDEVAVHVEDDGRGVPPHLADRVFSAGWSVRGGKGIGLYAVATTISAHQGRVRCVPLDRGTRFTIHLPLARARAATA